MILVKRIAGVWYAGGEPYKSFHDALVSVWPNKQGRGAGKPAPTKKPPTGIIARWGGRLQGGFFTPRFPPHIP